MRGKRRRAELGRFPAGFGRYGGPYGTRWDPAKGHLVWLSESYAKAARQILDLALAGETISKITKAMNDARIPATGGGFWHRSAVHRVLSHARLYAGNWEWDGIPIANILECPIASLDEAEMIGQKLRHNRVSARGYGKRHWLTGHVHGQCGRGYSLAKRGCRCRGRDRRLPKAVTCGDRHLGLKNLELAVLRTLDELLTNPDRLRMVLIQSKARQDLLAYKVDEQRDALQQELEQLEKRRRLLSIQHELAVINDVELSNRFGHLDEERVRTERALRDLGPAEEFTGRSLSLTGWLDHTVPLLMFDVAKGLAELERPKPEHSPNVRPALTQIAEVIGLRVTVGLDDTLTIQLKIPTHLLLPNDEVLGSELGSMSVQMHMLTPTSRCYARLRPLPPARAWHAPDP